MGRLAGLILIALGLFLIVDAAFLHLIRFDYNTIGLGWLDPYFSHAYWGMLFVIVGYLAFRRK